MTNTSSLAKSHATSEAPHDTPLTKKKVALAVVLGGLVVVVLSIGMWCWVNGTPWTGEQKATAHLDVVKVSASLVVMLGGLGALYLTMLRQRTQDKLLAHAREELAHARETAAASDQDAVARRVTELYAKSVEQLGSDKGSVRLGGMYALERLAQDNADQRQTVVNVLCAYLRMPYAIPNDGALNTLEQQHWEAELAAEHAGHDGALPESIELIEERERYQLRQQEHEVRLAAVRILVSHLRPHRDVETNEPSNPTYWSERLHLDLAGARLTDADFSGCEFDVAVFDKVNFRGSTSFSQARFQHDASFRGSRFVGSASFERSKFDKGVNFVSAEFRDIADFGDVEIHRANFREAHFLTAAKFENARFMRPTGFIGTTFQAEAMFLGARFGVVDFERAEFMGTALFVSTHFRRTLFSGTRFRAGVEFAAIAQDETIDLSGASVEIPQQGQEVPSRVWPAGWELGPAASSGDWNDELWRPLVRASAEVLNNSDAP